ncbi:hypothetical protein P153DRAFT_333715 [Dothidotthia symphoricarpi CBS 119687]|uniref:GCN5-related N-acetyltransferase Rv2170-like domain-containing protein n=1 Tax=Dothidotthia symphoricarpi CBS 119687 TaxID=1392245 RepID=A0A6A6APS7_9PLEO|nr:uncharacterized protein P153DRAFT_333715 [Dothidotthia symphoricarpi CBS 119687]KAF2132944.1 hypothetical protein P153DRAFT_333715 [Dothidotthia symphoricarpi CBS 119687]
MAYEHPATSPTLLHALKSNLPYSINLVYRTQHPNRTKDAHILATFPPTSNTVPECWAAAYLDRSMRPETELWIFAAAEMPNHSSQSDQPCSGCRGAVLALLKHMATLPVPPLHPDNLPAMELAKQHKKDFPEPGPDGSYAMSPGTYMRHLLLPSVVTLGACHHVVVQICRDLGVLRREFPGPNAELNKFLFKICDLPQTKELPEGLRWGEVREEDVAVVQSRTSIPRSARTLLSLKSVGVFEETTNRIVSWTFLGLDGSLTTLHTEPEYRGKGIAKAVAAKVFREYAPDLAVDEDGGAWSHADVYVGNVESESVCRSLAGKAMWKHFWVRIDPDKAGTLGDTK